MRKLKGYENAKTYTERERLPVGGYIIKILDVKEQVYSCGEVLVLSFDIIEGEHKDFFKEDYKSQQQEDKKWKGVYRLNIPKDDGSEKDEWTMRTFKTAITAIEESNEGYHWNWDEQTLKNKIVGAVFHNREYEFDGRRGFYTACHSLRTVDAIRNGKFKIPADKLLKKEQASQIPDGFEEIDDSDIPF